MTQICGMKVVVNDHLTTQPKLQLSPGFNACSHQFKQEMNAWLLEKFGTREHMFRVGNTIVVSSRTYETLRRKSHEPTA